jgi:predicted alpha/beta-hydrolase family hydrolase
MPQFLITGPADAPARLLCAHGAGAGMETAFLTAMAALLAQRRIATYRFEFGYMAARRGVRESHRPEPSV